jgi:hypothetical protein
MTMTDDNCTNGCIRQSQITKVDKLLAETQPGDPSRPTLFALSLDLTMTPCATYCDGANGNAKESTCN